MEIKEFLKKNVLITDGAMGTYYAGLTGQDVSFSELANVRKPELIADIHSSYINAGAGLIRTNTFSANSFTLEKPGEEIKEILRSGLDIARQTAKKDSGRDIFVAADIGPVPEQMDDNLQKTAEEILAEYRFIIDTFLEEGAKIFLFETFSSLRFLPEITGYIKQQSETSFVITQFALDQNGFTRKGTSVEKVIANLQNLKTVDAYGFNCGVGPAHLAKILQKVSFNKKDIISALPNAGYPEIVNQRTVYAHNADYFAEKITEINQLGVNIVGGCCGTTPLHIEKISQKLAGQRKQKISSRVDLKEKKPQSSQEKSQLKEKMQAGKFITAVELDPPFSPQIEEMLTRANLLKNDGRIDVITIPDSPLGRVRLDSLMSAVKIKRELGMETLPHLTCRDQNIIGIKSRLMTASTEGINNILAVTGDPVPGSGEGEVQGVFSINSFQLIELITEMNKQQFEEAPYYVGAAFNINASNIEMEKKRLAKKVAAGAEFFLTQPIFSEQAVQLICQLTKEYDAKIIAGILPPVSYKNARFLKNEIPGMNIPDSLVNRFDENMSREQAEEVGIEIAVSRARKIQKAVDGFYFLPPFNRIEMIIEIMNRLGI